MDAPVAAPSFESERIRDAWASVRPVSLKVGALMLGLSSDILLNCRRRNTEGFPKPIGVLGDNGKLMVYSADELEVWDDLGRDLTVLDGRERLRWERLRFRTQVQVAKTMPTTIAHAATVFLPDADAATAVKRVRTWRDRGAEALPRPLPVEADYTVASSVYSMVELQRWWAWWRTRRDT